ncbi:MAG: 4-hydroxybenzoyl-CoA thioesterase [Melioribacteraceae bacterium]|nr:MAG: 4-hydroxybenzoyl-CoA thioesterase [Melioribacteraceae bacterium]
MFAYDHVVKFHECDPAGILFYGNVYFIAHDAYEKMINSRIPNFQLFSNKEYAFPLIKSEAEYLSPVRQGRKIRVELYAVSISGSSFKLEYNFYDIDKLAAVVTTTHVCVERESFKKAKLPQEVKGLLLTVLK